MWYSLLLLALEASADNCDTLCNTFENSKLVNACVEVIDGKTYMGTPTQIEPHCKAMALNKLREDIDIGLTVGYAAALATCTATCIATLGTLGNIVCAGLDAGVTAAEIATSMTKLTQEGQRKMGDLLNFNEVPLSSTAALLGAASSLVTTNAAVKSVQQSRAAAQKAAIESSKEASEAAGKKALQKATAKAAAKAGARAPAACILSTAFLAAAVGFKAAGIDAASKAAGKSCEAILKLAPSTQNPGITVNGCVAPLKSPEESGNSPATLGQTNPLALPPGTTQAPQGPLPREGNPSGSASSGNAQGTKDPGVVPANVTRFGPFDGGARNGNTLMQSQLVQTKTEDFGALSGSFLSRSANQAPSAATARKAWEEENKGPFGWLSKGLTPEIVEKLREKSLVKESDIKAAIQQGDMGLLPGMQDQPKEVIETLNDIFKASKDGTLFTPSIAGLSYTPAGGNPSQNTAEKAGELGNAYEGGAPQESAYATFQANIGEGRWLSSVVENDPFHSASKLSIFEIVSLRYKNTEKSLEPLDWWLKHNRRAHKPE